MFENLEDARFVGVAATYGPATDAPQRLRALADRDPKISAQALYWIEADYFHQGLYCNATPLTVPYLLEVVQLALPVQGAVLRLLGEMQRGGADAPNDLAVYAPAQLGDGPEAAARRAVEAGASVLTALLDAPDPIVRCAAMWTNAGLGPAVRARLVERLQTEPDPRVRICGWIALSTLGALPVPLIAPVNAPSDVAEADVLSVLGASTPLDEVTGGAFVRLLGASQVPWLPFAEGHVHQLALHHLQRLGPDEPRRGPILKRAIETGRREFGDIVVDFCSAVFPTGVPHAASDLNDMQRWALQHVWVGEARGIKLPYKNLSGQREFVEGGGPLDDVVTLRGRTCSVAEHLLGPPTDFEATLAHLARNLPAPRVFQLATALTRGDLGNPGPLVDAVLRTCSGSVTLERTLAYLEARDASTSHHDAELLLSPYFAPVRPSPEALDPLARVWLQSGRATLRTWLRTFPPQRRVQLVAPLNQVEFWSLCDPEALGTEVLERFLLAPLVEHEPLLYPVSSSLLRTRGPSIADPRKRAQIDLLLERRAARTELSLSARKIHTMTLELMLPNGARLVRLDADETQTSAELDPIRAVLGDSPSARFTIYVDNVPAWIVDTLRDELGDRVQLR